MDPLDWEAMALHHHAVFKMESSVKTHGRRQTGVASPEISMVSCLRYYVVSSLLSNLGMRGGREAMWENERFPLCFHHLTRYAELLPERVKSFQGISSESVIIVCSKN